MKINARGNNFGKASAWVGRHKVVLLIILSTLVVILAGGMAAYLTFLKPKTNLSNTIITPATKPKPPEIKKYYSPLTGVEVKDESSTKAPVTGVMIENSQDARPQSGLKNSGVVFEAIAEGGITRFLVLYQAEKPALVGPVRSLRLYDVDWLAAFNAGIAHVGGSAAALSEIRNGNYRDLDQFFNSSYYWRASDRYAPHNVYTSFEKLDALNKAKGYESSTFSGFLRGDGKVAKTQDATNIDIKISSYLFNSTYVFDPATNSYSRYQAGAPHLDREDGQIKPSVVIAIKVDETTVLEDGYRESINTIGSGQAFIFQNGTVISGTWQKPTKTDQIKLIDSEGKEIVLNRGQTWIAAVPNGSGDVSWR